MKATVHLTLTLLAILLTTGAAANDWKSRAGELIAAGEFAKAERILGNLSAKEKEANEVTVDSLKSVMLRMRSDFSITPAEGKLILEELMGRKVTSSEISRWKECRYIETMNIDGQQWWFRKLKRNFRLLNWEDFHEDIAADAKSTAATRQAWIDAAMKTAPDRNGTRDWHKAVARMTLDVYADSVPDGKTVRVWLPVPFENMRQRNICMESSSHPLTYSEGSRHHTVYMEAKAQAGKPTHFEINYTYETGEHHVDRSQMLKKVKPYDRDSELYRTFTKEELPHMIVDDKMKFLARKIVRNETNPVLQAARIYDYIATNFPWAGARDYSTIDNIPMYVLRERHGDCGQVVLLYISLCRSIGIPARWESGWCTDPGDVDWHDWAATYFEGVGWVNTDVSYGRAGYGGPQADYYKSGIDMYRLSTNEGIADVLSPAKKYARCESVDFQSGEVEWEGGNLETSAWESELTIEILP